MAKTDCAVCKLIRTYVLFAVPLLALLAFNTAGGDSAMKLWFARTELIDVLSWGSLVALCAITLYRVYEEYYLPRRRTRKLQRLRSQFGVGDIDGDVNDIPKPSSSFKKVEHDG